MSEKPDVVFVVLDSLRKDHISLYESERPTTPAFDALAEQATTYENAFAPAPWTLPSHCSMFTGCSPAEHGITNGFTDRNLKLPRSNETIAEALAAEGYRTAGFSNNPWVGQLSDLDRGFDHFVEWDLELSREDQRPRLMDRAYDRGHSLLGRAIQQPLVLLKRRFFTENLVSRARRWVTEDTSQPTFTFLNLMEAHSPYYPPDSGFEPLGIDPPNPVSTRMLNTKLLASIMGKRELNTEDQRRIHDLCEASIRYQDGVLERLISTLREANQLDDTLLVICSDHGKTLGEFDRDETPPHYLRNININVPLLIKQPGQQESQRIESPVELADLYDVVRTAGESMPREREFAFVEDYLPHTARESMEVTRWAAVSNGETTFLRSDSGQEFVYKGTGPTERVSQDDSETGTVRLASDALTERYSGLEEVDMSEQGPAAPVDAGIESQLEDLGYL